MSELTLIAKATLMLGLALLVCGAARAWPASVRAFVLACGFAVLLALPIASLALLGRPLVDRTSLPGAYDVSLLFAPTQDELSTIYELPPDAKLPSELTSRPSVFRAFEQQLGLRLEPTYAALDVLAVDWAARPVVTPDRRDE